MATDDVNFDAERTHVWVKHSETGGVWACPVDYLDVARVRGWEPTDEPDTSLDGLFDEATAEGSSQTGFDPAAHNVDEVKTYLAEHQDSPGEVERVLELERAGKNRSTITGD